MSETIFFAYVWNFLVPVYEIYLIEHSNFWRQTTVNTQYLTIDQGSNGQMVKNSTTVPPCICIAILKNIRNFGQKSLETA